MKIDPAPAPGKGGRLRALVFNPYISGAVVGIALFLVGSGLYSYCGEIFRGWQLRRQAYARQRRASEAEKRSRESHAADAQTGDDQQNVPKTDRLVLDIKFKNYQKIAYKRELAHTRGVNITTPEDYVPAKIRFDGQTFKVAVRLKGTFSDHWSDPKRWSLLIKVRGDHTIFGMKRFGLLRLRSRGYLAEWLFTEALRREGVLAPRVRYVYLTLNGEDYGLYMLEEHYGKRLVESQGRREGPIVGYDKAIVVGEYARGNLPNSPPTRDAFWAAPVDGTQSTRIVPGSPEDMRFRKAVSMLEAFRRGRLPAGEVFDVEKMATMLAMRALFCSLEVDWKDVKFYFNPLTARLEPIGSEVHSVPKEAPSWWTNLRFKFDDEIPFGRLLLDDPRFQKAYMRALERVSKPGYFDGLCNDLSDRMQKNLCLIATEEPSYRFSPVLFRQSAESIRKGLHPVKPFHAYFESYDEAGLHLAVGNIQTLPVEVEGVRCANGGIWKPAEVVLLPPKGLKMPVDYRSVTFLPPKGSSESPPAPQPGDTLPGVTVQYRMFGTGFTGTVDVYRWRWMEERFLIRDLPRREPNVSEFAFLHINEETRHISIAPGNWMVAKDMILPAGYTVVCGPRTHLDLTGGASILSRSPLEFAGSEDEPIVISSADGKGQGVFVLETGGDSRLCDVVFQGLSVPAEAGWSLTGAVTFYKADVTFKRCRFLGNRSGDDALNTIHSKVIIEDCRFTGALADALDWDFCHGTIRHVGFTDSGNDAMDFSGSVAKIEQVLIEGAGDKGLSAGEGSSIKAVRVEVTDARVAFASKDESEVTLEDCRAGKCRWGLAVFQKKPEFGPASMRAQGFAITDVEVPYIVEEKSWASVNGKEVTEKAKGVSTILYPPEAKQPTPPADGDTAPLPGEQHGQGALPAASLPGSAGGNQ